MAKRLATVEEVLILAPELRAVDPCVVGVFLELAGTMINLSVWRAKGSFGHKLFTAHLVTVAPSGLAAGGGVLKSVKVGPISKTFAIQQSDDAELGSTRYGQMYIVMRRTLCRTPIAVVSSLRNQFKG